MKGKRSFLGSVVSGIALLVASAALAGCSSSSLPLPTITGVNPASVPAGSAGFTLKVMGTGFLNTDVVEWNGQVLATQAVSSTELDAQVPANLIAAAAQAKATVRLASLKQPRAQATPEQTGDVSVDITVLQKPPGSVVSNTMTFTIVTGPPTPDFSISASPSSQTVTAGLGTTYNITVGALNGFTGMVNLSVNGLPSGATGSFTPPSVTGSGTSGLAVSTTSGTAAGTYPLTITGTSGTLTHSTTVTLVVNAAPSPDFSISASPSSQTVMVAQGTTYNVTTGVLNGFTGAINLTVSGLPTGATGSFTPPTVTGAGTSSLAVSTGTTTTPGNYTLTITGTSGSLVHTTTVTLVLSSTAPKDFSISASPSSQTVNSGGTTTYNVTITAMNGFTGIVTLGTNSLPSGATASFNPMTVTGSGTSVLTIGTGPTAPAPGPYTFMIMGTSGSLSHSTDVVLTVNAVSGGAKLVISGNAPASASYNNNVTDIVQVKNTGGAATSGTVTVQLSSTSSLFSPFNLTGIGDPWVCDQVALSCTRSDPLPAGQSYPPIALTYQIGTGATSPLTVTATVTGGGQSNTTNNTVNIATPIVNCSPAPGILCGQYALFVQGYTSAGPRALAASFTADGNGHITAGVVDVNSMAAPQAGLTVLAASPTAYNFESNGFGNLTLSTSAGTFVFKFVQSNFGNNADVIEFEPSGNAGGSGFMIQQNPTNVAAGISGTYALGVSGGLGGASAGVRLGMIGAVNANGTCGFGATGSTGTINDGGSVSTAVSFSGTLNPASCTIDPTTGRGTLSVTSVTGSPAPPFTNANFVFYVYGTNQNGTVAQIWLLSTDQTSTSHPLLSGTAALQSNAPYSTSAAIDCAVASNPSSSTGCVFASSGATGGNSISGSGHVTAGVAKVTTQSNTAGSMSLLFDDNKAGVINSGPSTASYSYEADGTGVITPSAGEGIAFVLTGTDSGIMLGTGGSVAVGTFVAQTATNLTTSSPANFIAVTQFEGTDATTNTLLNSTFTPTAPTPSNSGPITGNTRSWNSSSLQAVNTLSGNYSTAPATGRGTGTTSASNGIEGATSFTYYVINANSFLLIGTTSSGAGSATPVLVQFQVP